MFSVEDLFRGRENTSITTTQLIDYCGAQFTFTVESYHSLDEWRAHKNVPQHPQLCCKMKTPRNVFDRMNYNQFNFYCLKKKSLIASTFFRRSVNNAYSSQSGTALPALLLACFQAFYRNVTQHLQSNFCISDTRQYLNINGKFSNIIKIT